jgi:hypothetical protein
MKFFIICISMLLVHVAFTNAQDIEAMLSGSTTTQGFTVKSNTGTPLFTVRGDGKIGLGILNPDVLLHVAGQVKITGGTPGMGKVLTSDANGLATWKTPAGGGLTLDQAYDHGGAGAGRTITADAGAVVVAGVDGFLVTGESTSQGTIPATGAGIRMMWYPKKCAFRAGSVDGTQWDDANIGSFSIAMGLNTIASDQCSAAMGSNTTASGPHSTAMGNSTTASGGLSTAMGIYTTASGNYSTAMGNCTIASGHFSTAMGAGTTSSGSYSTAMGNNTTASDNYSTAMGTQTTASGYSSTAMGNNTTASGTSSTAMGSNTTASGNYSTAMGRYASTGGYSGSMAISDASTTTVLTNTASHQWMARFAGGIRFYTNSGTTTGAYMNGNASGWTNICDRNKKENFSAIDGEAILARLRAVPVSEWNYKGTETSIRYIGPMAQDFWQAFHLGGTDSLGINSISIDGVNMAAIQALEKRTTQLNEKTAELNEKTAELSEKTTKLNEKTAELQQKTDEIASLKEKVATLESAQAVYAAQAAELRQLRNDLTALKALLTEKSPAGNGNHASLDPGK